jgi:transcriptional regulator with XRE-family HTH domain
MIKNPLDLHIGKTLKMLRTISGLSQEKLGDLIGLTAQQIQKYEKGLNRINASRLYEIAQVLNRPLAIFFEDYIGDKYYHNFEFKKEQERFESEEIRNKEIINLIKAFNKIENYELRRNIIVLLNSLSKSSI